MSKYDAMQRILDLQYHWSMYILEHNYYSADFKHMGVADHQSEKYFLCNKDAKRISTNETLDVL